MRERASRIKVGMTRAEVEQIFKTPDGGLQGTAGFRYYEDPEVMIEVPYDQTGGPWSNQKRVIGPVRIYRSAFAPD